MDIPQANFQFHCSLFESCIIEMRRNILIRNIPSHSQCILCEILRFHNGMNFAVYRSTSVYLWYSRNHHHTEMLIFSRCAACNIHSFDVIMCSIQNSSTLMSFHLCLIFVGVFIKQNTLCIVLSLSLYIEHFTGNAEWTFEFMVFDVFVTMNLPFKIWIHNENIDFTFIVLTWIVSS